MIGGALYYQMPMLNKSEKRRLTTAVELMVGSMPESGGFKVLAISRSTSKIW
jgi:hypothetical protein